MIVYPIVSTQGLLELTQGIGITGILDAPFPYPSHQRYPRQPVVIPRFRYLTV